MLDMGQVTRSTIVRLEKYVNVNRILINSNVQRASLKEKMAHRLHKQDHLWETKVWEAMMKNLQQWVIKTSHGQLEHFKGLPHRAEKKWCMQELFI